MSQFNTGDTIRCIQISKGYATFPLVGEKYIVKATYNDGWVQLKGKIDELCRGDISIGTNRFLEKDFELIAEKKETKGGSRYNSGKLRWRNVPMFLLRPVIEVGAAAEKIEGNPTGKYDTYNFLKGLSVADCMDSMKRHLDAVDDPNQSDIDAEDGRAHLAKVAWNALVALHYINTRPDLDDRYKGEEND